MNIEHERGYLVIAQNSATTDYIRCARVLALSIRQCEPDAKICLLTDRTIDCDAFDMIRVFPYGDLSGDSPWKLHNDWQCFYGSPFRQTIKLEADMIVPRSISHWFDICQQRDLVLTVGSRNYLNQPATSRHYRRIFDDNDLPDIYNAVTYWRVSRTAEIFFRQVRNIMSQWSQVMNVLKFAVDQPLNTDLAYALAALHVGLENCTLPISVPSLIHLKQHINGLQDEDWTKELIWEISPGSVRLNTVEQMWPVHYHQKDFVRHLEQYYG